jgi:glycosyltransferase involved in cell wall biosynthesis
MQKDSLLRQSMDDSFSLSIVAPIYNEEENVDMFLSELMSVVTKLTARYEVICVNDGSKDNTLGKLIEYHQKDPAIKIINLSRNFGQENALTAGLDYSCGDVVIPIDADLQDPPALIAEMISKWKEGFDIVYATRRIRQGESWLKKITSATFYKMMNKISDVSIPSNTGDFRLLDKRVVEALRQMPESGRFMKGLFSWVGFKQTSVLYDRQPRYSGKTKWNYWKLWNFALDGVTSFSCLPLRIWTYIGLLISLMSIFFALFQVLKVIIKGAEAPGYYSLIVAICFLGGIMLINLGILGEYVGRILIEVKKRPLYFISSVWGLDKDSKKDNQF